MPSELILVTGASGFLGSHVVLQLLEKGYRVRGVARGAKVEQLQRSLASWGDKFEAVAISDIAADQFPEALVGVDAVIHTASPLAGRAKPAELLKMAKEGTLNVVRQAEKAGVRRFVVTASIASVYNAQNSFTDKDWSPVTVEYALSGGNELATYGASKKFAELALWEWADQHPHVEVTTFNPPFFLGPFTASHTASVGSAPDFSAISTNLLIYNLLFKDGALPPRAHYVDVRDVARAHVLALKAPPTASVGRKRLLFASPHGLALKEVAELIRERRPELADRLALSVKDAPATAAVPIDFGRLESVVGMKKAEFFPLDETVLDAIDSLLELEDKWRKAGHTIPTPPSL